MTRTSARCGSTRRCSARAGAQAFRAELAAAGVPDERIHFELFEGSHGGIDHRYPVALRWLAERLAR